MTPRVEQIGNATLYLGDCRDILPTLPKVDALVTDPPYGLEGEESFALVESVLAGNWWDCAAVILDWRNPIRGPHKVGELVWEYGWVSGFRAKAKSGVCHTHNTIHLLGDKRRFHFTDGSVIKRQPGFSSPRHCSFATKSGHPHEKPVPLMAWLLSKMDTGVVCDPFMGSGTTGVACVEAGKTFIGIECDPAHFDIACKRISEATVPR